MLCGGIEKQSSGGCERRRRNKNITNFFLEFFRKRTEYFRYLPYDSYDIERK